MKVSFILPPRGERNNETHPVQYDAYQIPTLRGFVTFINNPADLLEFFQAPETVLSLLRPLSEVSTYFLFLFLANLPLTVSRNSKRSTLSPERSIATPKHF